MKDTSEDQNKKTRKIDIVDQNEPTFDLGVSKKTTKSVTQEPVVKEPEIKEEKEEKTAQKKDNDNQTTTPIDHSFKLHISAANTPNANAHASEKINQQRHKQVQQVNQVNQINYGKKVKNKIWNTLEWLSTSAMIFIILFFAINYSSYSTLFSSKLDELRGIASQNPALAQMLNDNKNTSQQLLPLTNGTEQSKKVIPQISIIISPADDRVVIPRINKSVPIVRVSTENLIKRDWSSLEKEIQSALQDGVVHYPGTAQPGDHGNVVITGHSSYFSWDPGHFKDVFALLHQVNIGDKIYVYHNQEKYNYEVYDKKVINPDQVEVLTQKGDDRLTLITCTPVGTNLRRLVVLAKPIN